MPIIPALNAPNLPKPKAILLDWDNTIADSWPIIFKSLEKTFIKFGMEPWSFADVLAGRGNIHHSMRASFPAIFGDRWEEASKEYINAFLECHLKEIKLLPSAAETLKQIKEMGFYQAIVSNKTGKHLREEVAHLGLTHLFDKVIGATDATRDKPHADPIYMALAESGFEPENYKQDVWMVGDTKTDVMAAIAAGCTPVLFDKHWQLDEDIIAKHDIFHIKDHEEFVMLVAGL
jgi:phosphoglycolate phosphatase